MKGGNVLSVAMNYQTVRNNRYVVGPHLRRALVIIFSLLLIQCSVSIPVNVPASSIPPQAWRPGDSCKFRKQVYMMKDGDDIYLMDPSLIALGRKLDAADMIRYNIVGTIEPGDVIRISRCFRYSGSSVGGTYLEGVLVVGSEFGEKVVWHSNTIGGRYITTDAGIIFAAPDPEWYVLISNGR